MNLQVEITGSEFGQKTEIQATKAGEIGGTGASVGATVAESASVITSLIGLDSTGTLVSFS